MKVVYQEEPTFEIGKMSELSPFDLTIEQSLNNLHPMHQTTTPIFLEPITVQLPRQLRVVEEVEFSEEVWAAFDHLCEVYGIHDKPKKKFLRSA